MEPLLHPTTKTAVRAILQRPAAAWLFVGASGSGRRAAAQWLSRQLNCSQNGADDCQICRQIDRQQYPDWLVVEPGERSLGIAQIQTLQASLVQRPYYDGGWRMVLVDQADKLTTEAQNALLKLLEEPPPQTTLVLSTGEPERLLPTVLSRVGVIRFLPVTANRLAEWLVKQHKVDQATATASAAAAGGVPGLALSLATQPEQRRQVDQTTKAVQEVLAANLFERWLMVPKLLQDQDILAWLQALASSLRQSLRQTEDNDLIVTAHRLEAVNRTRQFLDSNVNARAALEALMLEL